MFLQKKSGDTTDREFEEFREFEGRELEELDCTSFASYNDNIEFRR